MLEDAPGEAAWNMAVDGALLALAETPTLRIYGWQPHAVSLGYFQRIADFADLPANTPIVRRSTGGGAIHHGDELTFSLALPAALLPTDISTSYELLHDGIIRALARIGVTSERATIGNAAAARPSNRWCFADPVRNDLISTAGKLVGGKLVGGKLLGSAQRRITKDAPRVLHHGSLVLQRPSLTPFVAAVADQIEVTEAVRTSLRAALIDELTKVLNLQPHRGQRSAAEDAMAMQLRDQQFGNAEFLRRR